MLLGEFGWLCALGDWRELDGEEENELQGSGGNESGKVAFWGMSGSLWREAWRNLASRLC